MPSLYCLPRLLVLPALPSSPWSLHFLTPDTGANALPVTTRTELSLFTTSTTSALASKGTILGQSKKLNF